MKQESKKGSVFDQIVAAFMNDPQGPSYLEDCMSFDPKLVSKVPLRYRIIALGFARHYSLDELNDKLKDEGCARLYSRSMWEAGLIYAFLNGMSYDEWKEIDEECERFREQQAKKTGFFSSNSVTLKDIRYYLDSISEKTDEGLKTMHVTKAMDQKLLDAALGKGSFTDFLKTNEENFSPVREKTRYYFCKYLYYYLLKCRDDYISERAEGAGLDEALARLAVFKGVTKLKRKNYTDDEVKELLDDSGISCGEIFDAFNYYYFEYVSLDWMEIQLEYYGNIKSIPEDERHELAASLRKYDSEAYSGLSDEEVLSKKQKELDEREDELDRVYSLESEGRGYQRNRAGENQIRKYIKGMLDIDRTTLICFLLFFGAKTDLPEGIAITEERLSDILTECGFSRLREEDDLDGFVIRFLREDDEEERVDLLMDEVTDYALDQENFFLYRMYSASRSAEEDFGKLTGR